MLILRINRGWRDVITGNQSVAALNSFQVVRLFRHQYKMQIKTCFHNYIDLKSVRS